MVGTKIYKTDMSNYTECAIWCNQNKATIEDKGDYYEVVALPLPTLEEIKQHKIAALKAERDSKEVEPIIYNENTYDYDDKARERINAAIIALDVQSNLAKTTASIDWTTADNKDVKVTADDLRMVITSVAQRSNALHVAYRVAIEKIEKASTKEEVEAITLEVGE